MATYVYGTYYAHPSYSGAQFRAWFAYTVSSTDTTYSITAFAGPQIQASSGAVGVTITNKLTGTGQTTRSVTKLFSTNNDDSAGRMTFISSKKWTWSKTTSTQSVTITSTITPSSGSFNTNTKATKQFTVPALTKYTITYNNNSGSGTISSTSKFYGKSAKLSNGSGFTRTGYTLQSWNTKADGTGTTYELGATYNTNANVTLYAQWSSTYAITGLTATRTNEDGEPSQRGEHLSIVFSYNTLTATNVSYSIAVDNTTVKSGTFSTTSGTIEPFITTGSYATDETHTVTVTLGGVTKTLSVPITPRPIDILGTGDDIAMGIMSPANPDFSLMLTPKCSINSDGNLALWDGGVFIPLGKNYNARNSNGDYRALCYISTSSDNHVFGGGSYNNSESTVFYEGNTIRFRSRGGDGITMDSDHDYFRPTTTNKMALGTTAHYWTRCYCNTSMWTASDKKLKDSIDIIDFAQDLIMNLKPVQFKLKANDHRRIHMGFIAQEVNETAKKLNKNLSFIIADYKDDSKDTYLGEDADDNELNWGLAYEELIAPTIAVVQKQQKEIEQLKKEVEQLKKEVEELKKK